MVKWSAEAIYWSSTCFSWPVNTTTSNFCNRQSPGRPYRSIPVSGTRCRKPVVFDNLFSLSQLKYANVLENPVDLNLLLVFPDKLQELRLGLVTEGFRFHLVIKKNIMEVFLGRYLL